MDPYERLMAEQWPTGKFGRAEPVQRPPLPPLPERPPERRPIRPWTPEEQAQHRADLLAALEGWRDTSTAADRRRKSSREHTRHTAAKLRRLKRGGKATKPADNVSGESLADKRERGSLRRRADLRPDASRGTDHDRVTSSTGRWLQLCCSKTGP